MSKSVLIAGGSGLIGKALTEQLIILGYQVRLLGRKKITEGKIDTYIWDPSKGTMDQAALIGTDFIINLAGANVGEGKWTEKRKEELILSRTSSTKLLVDSVLKNKYPIKKFIQASAIGYYGLTSAETEFTENDKAGEDFLAQLTSEWEKELEPLFQNVTDVLIFRIGVVLSNKSGALVAMMRPVKMFFGAALGSGKQMVTWIHIDDLVSIFIMGIEESTLVGTYNAVAPTPVSNKELTKAIGAAVKRPIWPISVPSFLLKIILGEQAQIVLKGNKGSAKKILDEGYQFKYPDIKEAVKNLLSNRIN